MNALVKTQKGKGFLELRNVPESRQPGSGEVKIKIAACGICGTDIHVKQDEFPYWPPVILGHEFSGTVVEVGPDCISAKVGDRIVAEPHTKACGVCYLCRTGQIQICPNKRSPGWGIDGAFTSFITYPEKLLHKIPDHMTFDQAALVEPTANCVTDIIEHAQITAGDFAVVIGPGPIGLLAALVARAAGAREVLVVGTPGDQKLRLAKAQELGFKTVNIGEKNPVDVVNQMTGGLGADMVIECSGSPRAIPGTVDLVRKLGKICVIGLTGGKNVEVPWDKFAFKVCTVIFNLSTSYTSWDRTIALIASGLVPAEKLITHKAPLENWESLFEACENLSALKGLLIPS
jgi:L-iditol 2-dehydrogenase